MHDVINDLFLARTRIHQAHLMTKSFAQHIALGDLYESLLDLTDKLAEVWQGAHEQLSLTTQPDGSGNLQLDMTDPAALLASLYSWSVEIKSMLESEDSYIQNIWDEIQATIAQAKYKIDNLS